MLHVIHETARGWFRKRIPGASLLGRAGPRPARNRLSRTGATRALCLHQSTWRMKVRAGAGRRDPEKLPLERVLKPLLTLNPAAGTTPPRVMPLLPTDRVTEEHQDRHLEWGAFREDLPAHPPGWWVQNTPPFQMSAEHTTRSYRSGLSISLEQPEKVLLEISVILNNYKLRNNLPQKGKRTFRKFYIPRYSFVIIHLTFHSKLRKG